MSVAEIRRLATETERSRGDVTDLHSERIEKLRENEGFPQLVDDPKIVLHIIPYQTIQSGEQVGLESAVRNRDVRLPMLAARVIRSPNLSGDIGRVTIHSPHTLPASNMVQVFRSGFIEAVSTMGFVVDDLVIEGNMQEAPYLNASVLRESLERTVDEYLSQLSAYDAHGPYHIFFTLLGAEGYYVVKRPMRGAKLGTRPLGDNVVSLPAVISNSSHDAEEAINQLMDQAFQAVGAQTEPRVRSTE